MVAKESKWKSRFGIVTIGQKLKKVELRQIRSMFVASYMTTDFVVVAAHVGLIKGSIVDEPVAVDKDSCRC